MAAQKDSGTRKSQDNPNNRMPFWDTLTTPFPPLEYLGSDPFTSAVDKTCPGNDLAGQVNASVKRQAQPTASCPKRQRHEPLVKGEAGFDLISTYRRISGLGPTGYPASSGDSFSKGASVDQKPAVSATFCFQTPPLTSPSDCQLPEYGLNTSLKVPTSSIKLTSQLHGVKQKIKHEIQEPESISLFPAFNSTHQLPDCVSEFFDEDSFYKDTSQQAKYQPGFGKYVLDRPITPDWSKIKEENLHGLKDIPHASQVLTAKRSPSTDYDDEETLEVLQSLADASQEYDSYSLATSDEEEMAKLIDPVSPVTRQQHIPPSSVLRGLGTPSTIETFDPNLQRSPPTNTPSKMTQGCPTSGGSRGNEEELLDYDVDWDIILNSPPSLPKDPSLFGSSNKDMIAAAPGEPTVGKEFSSSRPPQSIQKPFVRPPFPQTMRDKSPVIGLSNSSMLRTCFRIGQLVNEGARCFSTQKDVTFELYARIMSSSREPFSRVQHFRFMDLFKEQLPYPTGTLTGWKMGSLLDRQCSVFLTGAQQQQTKRMCRCICKLKKEGKTEKTELGWTISVLDIREVDWVEIDVIKRIVCRK